VKRAAGVPLGAAKRLLGREFEPPYLRQALSTMRSDPARSGAIRAILPVHIAVSSRRDTGRRWLVSRGRGIIAAMGDARIEAIEAAYAAWNRGEFDSVAMRGYHEDAVWERPEGDISFEATLTGRRTFVEAWEAGRSEEDWDQPPLFEVERIEELDGDRVLVQVTSRARGRRSGVEVSRRSWHLYEYRGAKVARVRWFDSESEALGASGDGGAAGDRT
jgi:ketosteroid isomerase-like protein